MRGADGASASDPKDSPRPAGAHVPAPSTRHIPFSLLLITDRNATGGKPLLEVVAAALAGGIDAVMLRDKDLPVRERMALAGQLRDMTRECRAALIVNGSVDICLAVEADGVHLPADGLPVRPARRILGSRPLIGVSAHSVAGLRDALEDGADYATLSPVFATPSKEAYGSPLGLDAFAAACRQIPIPVFALGGITHDRLESVLSRGAAGAAMISAVLASPNPDLAARTFVERFAAAQVTRKGRFD